MLTPFGGNPDPSHELELPVGGNRPPRAGCGRGAGPGSIVPPRRQTPLIKKPSIASIVLALIPFGGMCFSVPLWDRVAPRVFGLPFNMFWLLAWLAVTTGLMSLVYRIEKKR
jgi:hypothetical protein